MVERTATLLKIFTKSNAEIHTLEIPSVPYTALKILTSDYTVQHKEMAL